MGGGGRTSTGLVFGGLRDQGGGGGGGSGGQTRGVTAAVTGVRRGKSDGRESRAGAGGDVDGWGCGQDRRQ